MSGTAGDGQSLTLTAHIGFGSSLFRELWSEAVISIDFG